MIRFVDVSKDLGEDGYKFAWFNTITSDFEMHNGNVAWDTWEEFEADHRLDNSSRDIERYERLWRK